MRGTLPAPFTLDFAREGNGDNVEINSLKMRVYGKAGELYSHINGAAPAPEVVAAKAQDGKGAKVVGGFIPITNGDLANSIANQNTKLGIQVGFYPVVKGDAKGSTVLEVKVSRGFKVGLRQNKNKLFGKLVPVFK